MLATSKSGWWLFKRGLVIVKGAINKLFLKHASMKYEFFQDFCFLLNTAQFPLNHDSGRKKNKCWLEHPVRTVKTTSSSFLHASCWNRNIKKKKNMPLGHPFSVSAGRSRLVLNSLRFARACPGVKRSQVLQGSTQTSHYSVEIPQNYRTFAVKKRWLLSCAWILSFFRPSRCKIGIPKKMPHEIGIPKRRRVRGFSVFVFKSSSF